MFPSLGSRCFPPLDSRCFPRLAVAIMARSKAYLPFEGDATSDQELLGFSRSLEGMEGTDFDALPAGGFDLTHEPLPWNWKADLRKATPHLMSLIALTAVVLLWYALQNLYTDYMDQKKKGNLRRGIELARQRQVTFCPAFRLFLPFCRFCKGVALCVSFFLSAVLIWMNVALSSLRQRSRRTQSGRRGRRRTGR